MLRTTVKIDTYQSQCQYLVEVFDPARHRWNELWTLDPLLYKSPSVYSRNPQDLVVFAQKIIDELHQYAINIYANR